MNDSSHSDPQADLFELVEKVTDEQTFVAFLRALGEDFAREQRVIKAAGATGRTIDDSGLWESTSIDQMFEAATAWADSSEWRGDAAEPDIWRRCAEIVLAGKHYE